VAPFERSAPTSGPSWLNDATPAVSGALVLLAATETTQSLGTSDGDAKNGAPFRRLLPVATVTVVVLPAQASEMAAATSAV
jgi:hypothetical protein